MKRNLIIVCICGLMSIAHSSTAQGRISSERLDSLIHNKYTIKSIKLNGKETPVTTIPKTFLTFNKDGSYVRDVIGFIQNGTWEFFELGQYILLDNSTVYERYKVLSIAEDKLVIRGPQRRGQGLIELEYSVVNDTN